MRKRQRTLSYSINNHVINGMRTSEARCRAICGTISNPNPPEETVRQWLKDLKTSTEPSGATVHQTIRTDHQRLMMNGMIDWLTGGPSAWIAKWEDLIYRAREFKEPMTNWLADVSLVWQRVPDLTFYLKAIETDIMKEKDGDYSTAHISATIQREWERQKQGLALRYNKPRASRSAFATTTYDGQEAPEFQDHEGCGITLLL